MSRHRTRTWLLDWSHVARSAVVQLANLRRGSQHVPQQTKHACRTDSKLKLAHTWTLSWRASIKHAEEHVVRVCVHEHAALICNSRGFHQVFPRPSSRSFHNTNTRIQSKPLLDARFLTLVPQNLHDILIVQDRRGSCNSPRQHTEDLICKSAGQDCIECALMG